jgi:hypothetical protein
MNHKSVNRRAFSSALLAAGIWIWLYGSAAGFAQAGKEAGPAQTSAAWQSSAKLRRLVGKESGNLTINSEGIEFRPEKAPEIRIPYLEIQTFLLAPHSLTVKTYENRKRHVPGTTQYTFDLVQAVPPAVAVELARQVRRPSQNTVTDPTSQAVVIAAHHRRVAGGTNGVLRFRDGGIDYVTGVAGDSRSWRWADLQTLSLPDPYHLLVFGYRDTYNFDLKEVLPQALYSRSVQAIDAHNGAAYGQELGPRAAQGSERRESGAGNE